MSLHLERKRPNDANIILKKKNARIMKNRWGFFGLIKRNRSDLIIEIKVTKEQNSEFSILKKTPLVSPNDLLNNTVFSFDLQGLAIFCEIIRIDFEDQMTTKR